jgi:splicing factor 1
LKKNQLRLLATLNGTLRDDEGQACQNCPCLLSCNVNLLGGEIGHRKYDCPQIKNFNANVVCRRCGQQGHFARDCKVNLTQGGGYGNQAAEADADAAYQELMAELGGGSSGAIGGYGQSAGRIEGGSNPWQQPAPVAASVAPWVISPLTNKANYL